MNSVGSVSFQVCLAICLLGRKGVKCLVKLRNGGLFFGGWVFVFYFSVKALILEERVEGVGILAAIFKDYKSWTEKD